MIQAINYCNARILVWFILSCAGACYGTSSDAFARFQKGNEYYKKGEYTNAYDAYMSIEPKTANLNYNLGNCAYKLKRYGYALLFWRRAELGWGLVGREELLKNIDLVKRTSQPQETASTDEEIPVKVLHFFSSTQSLIWSVLRSINLLYLQIIFLIMWGVLFIGLRSLIRHKRHLLAFLLFIILANAAWMLSVKYSFIARKQLIAISPTSTLTSGPGASFAVLGHLREAQEAVILGESGDYYKIRVNNDISWINKNNVEIV